MQFHKAGDPLDRVIVEAQRLHPLAREFGPHHLVVSEAHGPGRFEAARGGFSHVVHERREAQHEVRGGHRAVRTGLLLRGLFHDREGMLVDVLVMMRLVGLQLQRGHLREHDLRESRVHHEFGAPAGMGAADQLDQFLAHPFGGDDLDPLGHRGHGLPHGLRHGQTQLGAEPRGTHHAQGIVRERVLRGPGGAQHTGVQVLDPAERVHELHARQPQGHGVDGEVAASQVFGQIVPEGHGGLAGIGVVRLGAVGGDLQLHAGLAHPDGPEFPADLPVCIRPVPDQLEGLIGARVRGEVQVQRVPAQQEVAYGPAHQGQLVSGAVEEAPQLVGNGVK